MKSTIIFYYSYHHNNTEALLKTTSGENAELFRLPAEKLPDISLYGSVGFASGIYFSEMGKPVLSAITEYGDKLQGKNCFIVYTCGSGRKYCAKTAEVISGFSGRKTELFGCKGYDTYGPFKLVGGIAKGRPNANEIGAATVFLGRMAAKAE